MPKVAMTRGVFLTRSRGCGGGFNLVGHGGVGTSTAEIVGGVNIGSMANRVLVRGLSFRAEGLMRVTGIIVGRPRVLMVSRADATLSRSKERVLCSVVGHFHGRGGSIVFVSRSLSRVVRIYSALAILQSNGVVQAFRGTRFRTKTVHTDVVKERLRNSCCQDSFRTDSRPRITLSMEGLMCRSQLGKVSFRIRGKRVIKVNKLTRYKVRSLKGIYFKTLGPRRKDIAIRSKAVVSDPTVTVGGHINCMSGSESIRSLYLGTDVRSGVSVTKVDRFTVGGFLVLGGQRGGCIGRRVRRLSVGYTKESRSMSRLSKKGGRGIMFKG